MLIKDRFESKFKQGNTDECWPWLGGVDLNPAGIPYGYFWETHNRKVRAYRFSYELYVKRIPKGFQIRHKCHNSLCINPRHLNVGTSQDNMDDKVKANRQAKGKSHGRPRRKFEENEIFYIRASKKSSLKLAKDFNVNPSTISRIRSRENWGWLF